MQEIARERHHNGMCGGACSECFEDQRYDDERREQQDREYEHAMEAAMYEEDLAEEWWTEWLAMAAA